MTHSRRYHQARSASGGSWVRRPRNTGVNTVRPSAWPSCHSVSPGKVATATTHSVVLNRDDPRIAAWLKHSVLCAERGFQVVVQSVPHTTVRVMSIAWVAPP